MELRHLRYLVVLGQELHFARAAEKLFITQPALSRQIQQLEEEMGVKLFDRNKRHVELTVAGTYMMEEAAFVLNHLERVVEAARRKERGQEGEIRIGFVGSAMQNVIPDLLVKLNERFPLLHTSLQELSNKRQLEALAHEELDIGFVRQGQVRKGFEYQVVYEDSFSLVLPKGHAVNSQNFESIIQVREEPFILFSNDYSEEYYGRVMSIFEDHGFEPIISHRTVQANTIFRLVEKHLGIAIIPSALAKGVDLDVQFISLESLPQRTQLSAVWNPKNRNRSLNLLLDLLR